MNARTIPCDNPTVLEWCKANGIDVQRQWPHSPWVAAGATTALFFEQNQKKGVSYRLVLPSSPVECAEPVVLEWWANNVEGGWVAARDGARSIETTAQGFHWQVETPPAISYRLVPPSSVESEPVPVEPEGADFPRFVQGAIRRFVRAGRGEPWVEVDAEGAPVEPEAPKGLPDNAVEVPWFLPAHRAWVVPPASPDPGTGWEYMTTGPRTEWFPWAEATCGGYRVIRFVPVPAATEDVPLHEVIGRTLPGGEPVDEVQRLACDTRWMRASQGREAWHSLPVNPDGTVTVLRTPEAEGDEA